MKRMFGFLRSTWLQRVLAAVVLALVIWFAGPLLAFADYHPLDPEWARVALITLLIAFWVIRHVVRQIKARLGNRKMLDLLVSHADNKGKSVSAGSPEIRERFEKAAALLKTMKLGTADEEPSWLGRFAGRRYAYQLPWYLFIGAPGSGKTTALKHSGLQFPLADALGNEPLHGVGGTRNCEWWFTDRAVLIDTAGRYTTQDSDARSDAAEWKDFIELIKRFRPRQPINGVLATISASDLLGGSATEAEMQRQATALRARVTELQQHVGHPFPVYLLVTKTDLLPGFTQFFEDLDREQREQVWGCTFDIGDRDGNTNSQQHLRLQLDTLEDRLFAQLLNRLQASRDGNARALVYGFPYQWVQLKEAVSAFAGQAFSSSRLTGPSGLRGVYFTSGTQEGTPIDRVLGSLSRSFGIERKLLPPQRPTGKSFFITRLLDDVVFAEAGLAGTSHAAEKRLHRLKWSGMTAGGLAVLTAIAIWTASFFGNSAYINEVEAKSGAFQKALVTNPPSADNITNLVAVLDAARDLAHTAVVDPENPPLHVRAGLFQGKKIMAGADQIYGRFLTEYLAPFASRRIESGLRQQARNPELQYETLKAYLMLHRQGKLDADSLKAWVAFDLENDQSRRLPPEIRQRILQHMEALLQRDSLGPAVAPDPALVAGVRRAQLQAPLVHRVYSRIKRQGMNTQLRDFRAIDAGGAHSQVVFIRRSGQPITSGVPGLFTYNGYYKGFNPRVAQAVTQLADEEAWVLGVTDAGNAHRPAQGPAHDVLADEVRRLYLLDYVAVWERYIADIGLAKTATLGQSIEQARILSGPDSPLPRLLRAMAKEVTLGEPPGSDRFLTGKGSELLAQGKEKLGALLQGTNDTTQSPSDRQPGTEQRGIEAIVDDRFEDLRRFVRSAGPNQPSPADGSLKLINELYTLLSATETAIKAGNTLPQSDVPNRVKAEAARMPEPVRSMLNGLANESLRQAVVGSRGNINARLAAMVAEPCNKALAGRYPFVPGSRKDVIPEDFARILARDGVMDDFFQKNLAPLVDTSSRPWRFRNLGDASNSGTSDALLQFERAQEIQRVFFPPGSNGLVLRMDIRPVSMDPAIAQLILDVDGQLISYAHDNAPSISVQWPGPRSTNRITLQTFSARGDGETQTFDGPWALFR
ncbi:type VI secretion system membrane subunit TssM, partial [Noviherbaspirillum sp.]|uniref:type VI secretion system membrane subunit TssM n=1 Tax=Noviherbaspirillum sp. TaxID=1926288 RepID=UPI002FE3EFA5